MELAASPIASQVDDSSRRILHRSAAGFCDLVELRSSLDSCSGEVCHGVENLGRQLEWESLTEKVKRVCIATFAALI